MLKGKFIAVNYYIRKKENFQINNLSFWLKKVEKRAKRSKKKEGNNKEQRSDKFKILKHWTKPVKQIAGLLGKN